MSTITFIYSGLALFGSLAAAAPAPYDRSCTSGRPNNDISSNIHCPVFDTPGSDFPDFGPPNYGLPSFDTPVHTPDFDIQDYGNSDSDLPGWYLPGWDHPSPDMPSLGGPGVDTQDDGNYQSDLPPHPGSRFADYEVDYGTSDSELSPLDLGSPGACVNCATEWEQLHSFTSYNDDAYIKFTNCMVQQCPGPPPPFPDWWAAPS